MTDSFAAVPTRARRHIRGATEGGDKIARGGNAGPEQVQCSGEKRFATLADDFAAVAHHCAFVTGRAAVFGIEAVSGREFDPCRAS